MAVALEDVLEQVASLRRLVEERLSAPPPSPLDLLTLDEAAAVLRVAPRTLREGTAGTHVIPRQSDRPLLYLRGDLDRFVRDRAEAQHRAQQRAARKFQKGKAQLRLAGRS